MSKVIIQNIWAEDLFKWFYNHVGDSGGDGAAAIVCENYKEVSEYFTEWWRKEIRPNFSENVLKLDFWNPKDESDGYINYHDSNENFIFTNKLDIKLHDGDYIFVVLEDCKFAFEPPNCGKIIQHVFTLNPSF